MVTTNIRKSPSGPEVEVVVPPLPPSGGIEPTQNVRWYDFTPVDSPDGSIANPYNAIADFNAEVLAAGSSYWELMLPAGSALDFDDDLPDLNAVTTVVYRGTSREASSTGIYTSQSQSGALKLAFHDLTLNEVVSGGGITSIEAYDCDLALGVVGSVTGTVNLYNCIVSNQGQCGDRTLFMSGGRIDGVSVGFTQARFENVIIGNDSAIVPQPGTTSFIACRFGTGITIDNSQSPTIELDPYSKYWFDTNAVAFDGTIVLTPSNGGFEPIQKTLWLDETAAAGGNGSIATPLDTWANTISAIQQDLSGEWQVMLPTGNVDLTATGSLSGVAIVTLRGVGSTSTFGGDFEPLFTEAMGWVFRDLQLDSLEFSSDDWVTPQECDGVNITTVVMGSGGNSFDFTARDSTFATINAGSCTSKIRLTNCSIGNIQSFGENVFIGCTVLDNSAWDVQAPWDIVSTIFGDNCQLAIQSTANLDKVSEVSLFSSGGDLTTGTIVSLSGDQSAQALPDNATGLDFTTTTRAILPATRLTANRSKAIATTGSVPLQTFTIDSYNDSGFTLTITFGPTIAVIGDGRARYVFQVDLAGTSVLLVSVTLLD